MGKTFYCTDWFGADTILHGGRDKDERTVGNNRKLIRRGDTIVLLLHNTDIVTYHQDSTCTLYMGGWDSVITKRALNDYSPALIRSAGGRVKNADGVKIFTAIWHSSDGKSPEKYQICRKCHGLGEIIEICNGNAWPSYRDKTAMIAALPGMRYRDVRTGYIWERCEICDTKRYEACLHAPGFEPHERTHFPMVTREYRERFGLRPCYHGFLEQHIHRYECYRCDGCGERDYGSLTIPTYFGSYDHLRVDEDGRVLGHEADVREFLAYKGKLEEFFDYRAGILAKMSGGDTLSTK